MTQRLATDLKHWLAMKALEARWHEMLHATPAPTFVATLTIKLDPKGL